jgi:RAP1 GTPase activating protein 1
MFHVSTLLPHSKSERQQLERKRHIGNDIVAIVFQETDTPFNPECITSQFLHVYLIVTPLDDQGTQYKVAVVHRDTVPSFGPSIFHSKIFQCDHSFKNWMLTKLINAEMASCRSSTIQKYQVKTGNTFDLIFSRSFVRFSLPLGTNKNEFVRKFVSNFT